MSWDDLRIEGRRVALRRLREDDVPLIEPWYRAAATTRSEPDSRLLVIARALAEEPIGILRFRTGKPSESWATIGCVVLAEEARRCGLGVDAVQLFEEAASRRGGIRCFRARVDRGNGLGLYFWLRLGYRPDESNRIERDDGLGMIRYAEGP